MQGYVIHHNAHEVLCREGDAVNDLYFIKSGKVLVCILQGSEVKAIATIGEGEFIGELSFFDGKVRSSNLITLEPTTLIQIQRQEVAPMLPDWYSAVGRSLTARIRHLDSVLRDAKIRHSHEEGSKPLSQADQRILAKLLTHQNT